MKTPTVQQEAETLVALIRLDYPDPEILTSDNYTSDWYCVLTAAEMYCSKHGKRLMWHPMRLITQIAAANDKGRFEEAWKLLTEYFAKVLTNPTSPTRT